jgi:hypothetical protein
MSHRLSIPPRGGRSPVRSCAALATVALTISALAVPAGSASAAQKWDRISGPTNVGQQLGLARTKGGTLHVVWNQGPAGSADTIHDTRFSSNGARLGTSTVAGGWGGTGGLALLAMPDGTLRLFATGGHAPNLPALESGVNVLSGQAIGSSWSLQQGELWGGAPAAATQFVGATLTKDSQPVTSWAGAGVSNFHVGVTGSTGTSVCSCSAISAEVATDAASGAVVMAGETIGSPAGTFVEQVVPNITGRKTLASGTQTTEGAFGISGRIGAPGVYVAYTDANSAGITKPAVRLFRYGGASAKIASGPFTIAKVMPGPSGRLWLAWGDADGMFVTRSSKSVGRFEPVQKLAVPSGASYLWNAEGEGSRGALDLFVDATTSDGRGYWHTRVLAKDALVAGVSALHKGKRTIKFRLTDAGDPLAAANIVVAHAGQKHTLKTNGSGIASLTERGGGAFTATASVPTYTTARISFSVKAH